MTAIGRALVTGPNLITLSRLAVLAAAVMAFAAGAPGLAVVLGALAGITDSVDGWWARKTGQVSRLGEILDQFCDVALELVLLVLAVAERRLPLFVILPYVLREIWVASIRRHAIELGENIPSRRSGKLKSAFLGWSCVPLFLPSSLGSGHAALGSGLLHLGQFGIWTGIGLSCWSGLAYTRDFARIFERSHP